MLIQINYGDLAKSDAMDQFVRDKVQSQLGHLTAHLTRVEVHLRDDNSPSKSSHNDKRCLMEARPKGRQPLAVEQDGEDIYQVISEAAGKLSRSVQKLVDKSRP